MQKFIRKWKFLFNLKQISQKFEKFQERLRAYSIFQKDIFLVIRPKHIYRQPLMKIVP